MELEGFTRALKDSDFAISDSSWVGDGGAPIRFAHERREAGWRCEDT